MIFLVNAENRRQFAAGYDREEAMAPLLPLTLNCGWDAGTLGPVCVTGADEVTAVAARITPSTVRRRHGVSVPVMRLLANAPPSGPSPFTCKRPRGVPYPGGWLFLADWPCPQAGPP